MANEDYNRYDYMTPEQAQEEQLIAIGAQLEECDSKEAKIESEIRGEIQKLQAHLKESIQHADHC